MKKFIEKSLLIGAIITISACQKTCPDSVLIPNPAVKRLTVTTDQSSCYDNNTNVVWQIAKSKQSFATWEEANDYAKQQSIGGHSNWRLPTKTELFTLTGIYEMKTQGNCPIKVKGHYWTGETAKDGLSGYWNPYPLCAGTELEYLRKKNGKVRLIRDAN